MIDQQQKLIDLQTNQLNEMKTMMKQKTIDSSKVRQAHK
jgi:hypothetical protein